MGIRLPGSGLQGLLQRPDLIKSGQYLIPERAREGRLGVLGYIADAKALGAGDLPFTGVLLPHQHPQQGSLATPVGADDTDAGPFIDIQVHA